MGHMVELGCIHVWYWRRVLRTSLNQALGCFCSFIQDLKNPTLNILTLLLRFLLLCLFFSRLVFFNSQQQQQQQWCRFFTFTLWKSCFLPERQGNKSVMWFRSEAAPLARTRPRKTNVNRLNQWHGEKSVIQKPKTPKFNQFTTMHGCLYLERG